MCSRLPSVRQLASMPVSDRSWMLQTRADGLRAEREGILSGWIQPSGCLKRQSVLEANLRRLAHVYAVADEFGLGVGQFEH